MFLLPYLLPLSKPLHFNIHYIIRSPFTISVFTEMHVASNLQMWLSVPLCKNISVPTDTSSIPVKILTSLHFHLFFFCALPRFLREIFSFSHLMIHEARNVAKKGLRNYWRSIIHWKHYIVNISQRTTENNNLLYAVWKTTCRNTLLWNAKLPNYC